MGRGRKRHRRQGKSLQEVVAALPPDRQAKIEARTEELKATRAELVQVLQEDVGAIWPLALDLLAPELPQTDWTEEQLYHACIQGAAQLWMICDHEDNALAAMVTILSPQRRCIVAICCGHNLWDYLGTRDQLYEWAKLMGMREVTFYGRPALEKLMPECKRAGVILRKEL